MKKLNSKGKIHPSTPDISDHLSLLPATILTLTVALSAQDREVLAYLISRSENNNFSDHHKKKPKGYVSAGGGVDQPPEFQCNCFRCYMNYWVRWDNSPNRELIHEIIDAYEDGLFQENTINEKKFKKERRKGNFISNPSDSEKKGELKEAAKMAELTNQGDDVEEITESGEVRKGSVRKLASFLGERIWSVWGIL